MNNKTKMLCPNTFFTKDFILEKRQEVWNTIEFHLQYVYSTGLSRPSPSVGRYTKKIQIINLHRIVIDNNKPYCLYCQKFLTPPNYNAFISETERRNSFQELEHLKTIDPNRSPNEYKRTFNRFLNLRPNKKYSSTTNFEIIATNNPDKHNTLKTYCSQKLYDSLPVRSKWHLANIIEKYKQASYLYHIESISKQTLTNQEMNSLKRIIDKYNFTLKYIHKHKTKKSLINFIKLIQRKFPNNT